TLLAPLVLDEGQTVEFQLSVGEPGEAGRREFAVSSRATGAAAEDGAEPTWTRHAAGALTPAADPSPAPVDPAFETWPPPGAEAVDIGGMYEDLTRVGYAYGPSFAVIRAAWRRGD